MEQELLEMQRERGLKVCLADKGEIGGATSSWSTKLIHGGSKISRKL